MLEKRILRDMNSLQNLLDKVLRPWNNWRDWTTSYTEISKEEMIQKMKKAMKKCIFHPPVPPPDIEGMWE